MSKAVEIENFHIITLTAPVRSKGLKPSTFRSQLKKEPSSNPPAKKTCDRNCLHHNILQNPICVIEV